MHYSLTDSVAITPKWILKSCPYKTISHYNKPNFQTAFHCIAPAVDVGEIFPVIRKTLGHHRKHILMSPAIYREEIMRSMGPSAKWIMMVLLLISVACAAMSLAKDKELMPEELIAEHIKSIGSPTVLEGMRTRVIMGTSTVQLVQGAFGQPSGQAQIASDGRKLGILMRYDDLAYPGEHFAFDGKDVTISRLLPKGKISPLAEFIHRFDGVMKEGLLGGALSIAWPLRNIQETRPRLNYNKAKLAGHPIHALEYRPRKGLGDLKIVLFFELETFHHIRTEYRLHTVRDQYDLLSEDFADFKEVDGMMLPQRYTISFNSRHGSGMMSFLAHWIFDAKQWIHNGQIDSLIFRASE